MSDKSATPILVAGAIGTVILLGAAWIFAASAGNQAIVNAKAYAEEKAALAAEGGAAAIEGEQPADAMTTEVKAEEPAEAEVAEAEPEKTETAEVEPEKAETAEAEPEASAEPEQAEAEQPEETEVAAVEPEKSTEETAAVTTAAAAAATTAIAAVSAGGDATAGAKVFRKCKACHKIGEGAKNSVGPNLTGVVGRVQGSSEGFAYSDGFKAAMAAGTVWTPEELAAFLTKPKNYMAGTKMNFPGLRKEKDRANVIAFLAQGE